MQRAVKTAQASQRATPLRRLGALLLAFVLLAGCATVPPRPLDETLSATFAVALTEARDKHLNQVPIDKLTLSALIGLRQIDPGLQFGRTQRDLVVYRQNARRPLVVLPLPATQAPELWGRFIAKVEQRLSYRARRITEAPPAQITAALFAGMLAALDPYSAYYPPAAAEALRKQRLGQCGLGLELAPRPDGVFVTAIQPGTPAAAADLQIGDRIVAVDGAVLPQSVPETPDGATPTPVAALQIDLGTLTTQDKPVTLTVQRDGRATSHTVRLDPNQVGSQTVTVARRGDVAVLRIDSFNGNTALQLGRAIEAERRRIDPPRAYVVDLRGNLGGLLFQGIAVADVFLPAGLPIISTEGRHLRSHQSYESTLPDLTAGAPVAVLIDNRSASSSEIVAAVLRDHGRAVLLGHRSVGKATVQTVARLPNGGELLLTWSRLLPPSGESFHMAGLAPTVSLCLPVTAGLAPGVLPAAALSSAGGRGCAALELAGADDPVMAAALAVLADPALYRLSLQTPS